MFYICFSSLGKPVSPNCQAEMRNFATMVFDNYQISPIIVAHCDVEIHNFCSNLIGKRDDGDMMDCLMTQATTNVSLGAKCFEAVRNKTYLFPTLSFNFLLFQSMFGSKLTHMWSSSSQIN